MEDFNTPGAEDFNEDDMNFGGDDSQVMKVGEEKEIGKEGLKKKLVKEGEGWDTPEKGGEVEVHYTGTLLDGPSSIRVVTEEATNLGEQAVY